MKKLLSEIQACTHCKNHLPFAPNPIVSAHKHSKVRIIGQAPGTSVHKTGIPWNDPSGRLLRSWLGVDEQQFYDPKNFALIPMGFCYPGKGKSGDLPPRPECAPLWHSQLNSKMPEVQLTLLIGQYAQKYYLQRNVRKTLTETVKNYEQYLPSYLPIPHPSPRNRFWLKKNPWFEIEILPRLQELIKEIL
ncbi:Uracil-DNA glycosylase [Zhouia amylolytica]|uniref:Uracil-DNA glycosylase n=1 Tax=Zhouia amylolytica TaxID=376730 RepID=A0A1I6VKS5_9FLAO|nr:uracil-DNA glycosylase family protein [Zhouia amylolytica]MCQ0112270.1 uracil-DNA glycosylase family protein [Zhouia amylolytica]SFT14298.1 Uracil-DNA glycosylase [Zhouia amylolytica]